VYLRVMKCQETKKKMHSEKLRNWKSSSNFIRCVKPRIMEWARRVSQIPESKMLNNFWKEGYIERDHMENLEIYGKILIWLSKKRYWLVWNGYL